MILENGTHSKPSYLCRKVFAKENRWQDNHFPIETQDPRQKLTGTPIYVWCWIWLCDQGINYVWH